MMQQQTPKDVISDLFRSLEWPDLIVERSKITCPAGDVVTFENKKTIIHFYYYNRRQNTYEKKNRPSLIIPTNVDPLTILYHSGQASYDISWFFYIKDVLGIDDSFEKLEITKRGGIRRERSRKIFKISETKFEEISEDVREVAKRGKSSKNRIERYLLNHLKLKHIGRMPKETTTIDKGDFSFMIDRFNLKGKNKKKDYEKFLNTEDIKNLEYFSQKLIQDEVFSPDFLHYLDEYFIKAKLKDIIELGNEILSLGTSDVTTEKAKRVIEKVSGGEDEIKQLETLWQVYFNKYLLYLVFSYKKIYPKIQLTNIDGDKKYPDFIGINHYNGLDIIEIKTHLKNVVTWDASRKNFAFSSEMSKAVIQTMNYMDAIVQRRFQNTGDATKITNFTDEENLYHPRGIIIISSTNKRIKGKLNKAKQKFLERDFTKLRNSLQSIEILTFSEILQIADDYVKNIHSQYEN